MSNAQELAHEIRTPLAALRSNTDLLEDALRRLKATLSHEAASQELLTIVEESLRVNRLACRRLEELILGAVSERQATNVHESLDSALRLLAHELKDRPDIRITKDFGAVAKVESRGGQLQQVFTNILLNAIHAMPRPGEIQIRTSQDGLFVHVAISDSGPGIAAELRDKIFERGFSTKAPASGSGLGLWICRNILEGLGGRIAVESVVGQGSTFTMTLPALNEAGKDSR